jgi:endonuclease/exonuclease/phosphatase family metal-dependent hydrolase
MQLRVMSYNIHRAIGVDRRFRPERIVRILDHHAPDLLLLQEVDDGVPRSRRVDLAHELALELGYPHVAIGHNVTLRKGRYGNATLSRFPIRRERNIDLTIDDRKRRGCQHTSVVVERGGRLLEVEAFNLHLGLSARERGRQIGRLVHSGEFAGVPPDRPCLIGGDFNDWRSRLDLILTEVLRFRCATARRGRDNGAIRTYPAFSPTGGLDRIYYRGRLRMLGARRCRLNVSRIASDHLPVVADFEVH